MVFSHIEWLVDAGERLKTVDGEDLELWELPHQNQEVVLSA